MATANDTRETTFTTPSDRELSFTRTFEAPRDLVFAAFTDPEHVPNWMLGPEGWSMPVCEMDVREGGTWHFVWRKGDGEEMAMTGVFKEVSPPEKVVQTEAWGGDWAETLNTTSFAEDGDRTIVTQTILYPSQEARDRAMATGMKDGASVSYDRLAAYLATVG
jgi:uncharacterized protein YndB with AHSA1/START domain